MVYWMNGQRCLHLLNCYYEQVSNISIYKYSLWVLVVLPFMVLFASLIINYYLKAFRELARIQSVDGSLLTNHLNETLTGLSTIRAFKKQDEFWEKNNVYLNKRIRITFWREATKKWFSTRINLISSMALWFTSIFWVS